MFINVSRQPAVQPQSGASRRLEPTPARIMSLPWDLSAQGTQLLSMFQAGGHRSPETSISINVSTGARRTRSALFDAPQLSFYHCFRAALFDAPAKLSFYHCFERHHESKELNLYQCFPSSRKGFMNPATAMPRSSRSIWVSSRRRHTSLKTICAMAGLRKNSKKCQALVQSLSIQCSRQVDDDRSIWRPLHSSSR